mmetsp:Transcript_32190/g.90604  ORF Transcript_32190/g.90604 Transcript_32190/m.90604 type:complete len:245 (-) Transcript_32190:32-766(-)
MADTPGKLGPVVEKEFRFATDLEPFGFVNVGAKVCEVVHGSYASRLGVMPGWYVAAIDGEELQGAMVSLCRRVPMVTTDELRDKLRVRRHIAFERGTPVTLTFWTAAAPHCEEIEDEEEMLQARSVDEFRHVLVAKYGSVVAAWHEALDRDGSGELSYREFLDGCRAVGFKGPLKQIFSEFDMNGSGLVSIMELDPSCEMSCEVGRCIVCTLPNPCPRHGECEQKKHAMDMRHKTHRKSLEAWL